MSEKISVVIPNWNGAHWLAPCLDSLKAQSFRDFRVYVVDNASQDGSRELLGREYPWVRLIRNSSNLGFAGGMNAGIRQAEGELIAALNNDTVTDPGWLAALAEAMDAHPEAGLGASRILDFADRTLIDSFGDGFLPWGLSFKVGAGCPDTGDPLPVTKVQSACAAASVYRAEMLRRIGSFDEDFFAYMEDIDLGLRAQSAGYECIFIPRARVYHIGSATSGGEASAFSIRHTVRNSYLVTLRNVPAPLLPIYLSLTLSGHLAALGISLLPGRLDWLARHRRHALAGMGDALRLAGPSLKKRRADNAFARRSTRRFAALSLQTWRLHRAISRH